MEIIIAFSFVLILIVVVKSSRKSKHIKSEIQPSPIMPSVTPTITPSTKASVMPEEPATSKASNVSGIHELLPRNFVVLDLETTGLDSTRDEIIEFGAIKVTLDSDSHVRFQTLVKPEKRIPKKITEITGITQKMVDEDGLELKSALTQFVEFIEDLPLVTFNAEFDMGFLYSAAKKHGIAINNRYTCALKRLRRAWPGLPSYRLVDLARMGKLPDNDTHRAVGDCTRALLVFTAATSTLGQKVRWSRPPRESEIDHKIASSQ
jgi:DNA polymerase III epsilon subunit family exonuclease